MARGTGLYWLLVELRMIKGLKAVMRRLRTMRRRLWMRGSRGDLVDKVIGMERQDKSSPPYILYK